MSEYEVEYCWGMDIGYDDTFTALGARLRFFDWRPTLELSLIFFRLELGCIILEVEDV